MKRKNKNGIRETINKHVKDVISETVKRQSIKNATNCITEDIMKRLTRQLKESIGHNDYGSISNALEECGWSYVDAYEVKNRTTGQKGTRYVIEPYGTDSCGTDEIKQQMIQLIGKDNVVFSEGRSVSAPEIKKLSMIVIDN